MKDTILIVDDTPTNLQVLVAFLAGSGYETLIAEDGPAALEQLANISPDLVLLDVAMPEMDGFETCQRMKQLEVMKDIPILFLTARTEMSDKLRGFEAGAVDYITKPIQKEEVIARVNTHLTILRQKRQLQQMLAQREKFMRIAAHDLRNLLTVIGGFSYIGKTSDEIPMKNKAFERISKANVDMQAIIEGFLSVRSAQSANGGSIQDFDLRNTVDQVVEQSSFSAQCKGMLLIRQLPSDALRVRGNPAHTHQILTNYVTNALKYSPPNTQIYLKVQPIDRYVRVEVQDHGPGIQVGERNKLFVEFARLSNKPTGGETSTGLGLSIVKTLAEAQGGTVGAKFPAEGGSVFWFDVPLAPES